MDVIFANNLLLLHIAKQSKDPAIFYKLQQNVPSFRHFARDPAVVKDFYDSIVETAVSPDGDVETRINGELWSIQDNPAVLKENGCRMWYQNGRRHRDNDLPAVVNSYGCKQWYQNGKLHRDNDLPAILYANGDKYWYQNGEIHRDNDLPARDYTNGSQEWYKNGKRYYL